MPQFSKLRRDREETVMRLPENSGWRCKPGYKIFVANRGEVRFDYPEHWIIDDRPPITFRDKEPPADTCRLQLFIYKPAAGRGAGTKPMTEVLEDLMDIVRHEEHKDEDPGYSLGRGDIVVVQREDLELAWRSCKFFNPYREREVISRSAAARSSGVLPMIQFDFPADAKPIFDPIWDEILTSLQVGLYIEDPTRYFLH